MGRLVPGDALGAVSNSAYGIVGPKGMDARVVRMLHDGFKKALEETEHLKILDQLGQDLWYRSSEEYAKCARETIAQDRALIERLGLFAK